MTTARFLLAALLTSGASLAFGQAPRVRLNPLVGLLEQKQPVFGLYAPSNRRTDAPKKTPLELTRETLAYRATDFVFDGSMEGGLARARFPRSPSSSRRWERRARSDARPPRD